MQNLIEIEIINRKLLFKIRNLIKYTFNLNYIKV